MKISAGARQFTIFLIAGLVSLAVDLSVIALAVGAGVSLTYANAAATIASLSINFVINRWNFRFRGSSRREAAADLARFALLAGVSALVTFTLFELIVRFLAPRDMLFLLLARAVVVGLGAIARFLALKFWVFR